MSGTGQLGVAWALLGCAGASSADVVTLIPVADAFVSGRHPSNNYGGAGSLSVAAAGLSEGEFQTLLRFDAGSAVGAFDAAFGAGQWTVMAASLTLAATPPVNPLFNPSAPGDIAVSWVQSDGWSEGTGTPNIPAADGVTFGSLPSLIGPADQDLGTFAYDGSVTGYAVWELALPEGFTADVRAGGAVTLRARPIGSAVAFLFNSRSFQTVANRPVLTISGGPAAPPCYANCDGSSVAPALNVADFTCFLQKFAAGDSYGNCDASTTTPVLNVADFTCFLQKYAAGCQ